MSRFISLVLFVLMTTACFEPMPAPPLEEWSECDATSNEVEASDEIGWADVAPIFHERCSDCHAPDGSAPFVFDSYEEVHALRHVIAHAVETRRMPPWLPNPCCSEYVDDPSLSPEERELMLGWLANDAPLGSGQTELAPAQDDEVEPDALEPGAEVVRLKVPAHSPDPQTGTDSLHCFLLDAELDTSRFITGFDIVPSDTRLLHHVLVHVVPAERAEKFERIDAQTPEDGWDCWGKGIGPQDAQVIGGWAPGYAAVDYPEGVGFELKPGDRLLLNMHYTVAQGRGTEHTVIDMILSDDVEHEAVSLGISHPLWLAHDGMRIEAGDEDAVYRTALDPTELYTGGDAITIHGVSLHMHALGASGTMAILRADGTWDCLLHIDDFDEAWQGQYFLAEPRRLEPGDRLYVECHWDNSAANQPEGRDPDPRTLSWGTDSEMCTGFLLGAK